MKNVHRSNICSVDVKEETAHVQQPIIFNLQDVRLLDDDSSRAVIDRVLFNLN